METQRCPLRWRSWLFGSILARLWRCLMSRLWSHRPCSQGSPRGSFGGFGFTLRGQLEPPKFLFRCGRVPRGCSGWTKNMFVKFAWSSIGGDYLRAGSAFLEAFKHKNPNKHPTPQLKATVFNDLKMTSKDPRPRIVACCGWVSCAEVLTFQQALQGGQVLRLVKHIIHRVTRSEDRGNNPFWSRNQNRPRMRPMCKAMTTWSRCMKHQLSTTCKNRQFWTELRPGDWWVEWEADVCVGMLCPESSLQRAEHF